MTKEIVDGAFAVEHAILLAEQAGSEAAVASANLIKTMLEQHQAMKLTGEIGVKAIRHAMKAVALAAELREEQIRAHGALNVDLKKLGLDEMFGKTNDPPSSEPAFDWRPFAKSDVSRHPRSAA